MKTLSIVLIFGQLLALIALFYQLYRILKIRNTVVPSEFYELVNKFLSSGGSVLYSGGNYFVMKFPDDKPRIATRTVFKLMLTGRLKRDNLLSPYVHLLTPFSYDCRRVDSVVLKQIGMITKGSHEILESLSLVRESARKLKDSSGRWKQDVDLGKTIAENLELLSRVA